MIHKHWFKIYTVFCAAHMRLAQLPDRYCTENRCTVAAFTLLELITEWNYQSAETLLFTMRSIGRNLSQS